MRTPFILQPSSFPVTTKTPQSFGGSFAPPLTDELLAQYDVLVSALDSREQTTDIIKQLLACVRAWWNEPDSTGGGKPHPVFGKAVAMIDLDGDIAARLWEAIPWREELESWAPLLDKLESEKVQRNGVKLSTWRQAVHQAMFNESLLAANRLYNVTEKLAGKLAANAAVAAAFPGWTGEQVARDTQAAHAVYVDVMAGKQSPSVPRPTLESTPVRDMAHSLLWHAVELERDREPLTADKIGA